MTPNRSVGRPGASSGRSSSSAATRAATPASLWAPSRRTCGSPWPASSSRPGQRTAARPRRTAASSTETMPATSRARSDGQRHGRVGGLVAAEQAHAQVRQPRRLHDQAVEVHARHRRAVVTSSSGTSKRAARRRMTARPAPLAPVTARSPRLMMAAFSQPMRGQRAAQVLHVVELDVGDGRHARRPRCWSHRGVRQGPPRPRRPRPPGARTRRRRPPSATRTRSAARASPGPGRRPGAPRRAARPGPPTAMGWPPTTMRSR